MHVRFLVIISFVIVLASAVSGAIAGELQDSNNKPLRFAQNNRAACFKNCGYALQQCGGSNSCLAQYKACTAGC